eukprot:4444172-Prymnesium_polylepis.1
MGLLLVLVASGVIFSILVARWRRLRWLGLGKDERHLWRKPWLLQVVTLVRRKELRLRKTRRVTTCCEFAMPILICMVLVVAACLSAINTRPATSYHPYANHSLKGSTWEGASQGSVEGPVPYLDDYLTEVRRLNARNERNGVGERYPPYDGAAFVALPDTPDVRRLVEGLFASHPDVTRKYISTQAELEHMAKHSTLPIWAALV